LQLGERERERERGLRSSEKQGACALSVTSTAGAAVLLVRAAVWGED